MNNILLVNTNKCKYPYPVYPLGMAHIASALLQQEYNVKILDLGINDDSLESTIADYNPDFIGLSIRNIDDIRIENTAFFIPDIRVIVKRIRQKTANPIILGGSAFSLFPDRILELSGADYGIISEGEVAIIGLLKLLSKMGKPAIDQLRSIPGLAYRTDHKIEVNSTIPLDPSQIPSAHREVALENYYRENSGVVNIQTQRGCPYKCCYCTYPLIEGTKTRYRSAEQIVSEILHAKQMGNTYFFIVDSVFNTSEQHVISVCEEMIRQNANVNWSCYLKPSNLSEELITLMGRAGLQHIEFGSDSFCDSVLHEYGKNFTFDDIYKSSEWARKADIHYAHFLITGGPGENEQTMQESFENSKRLKKTVIFPFTGMRIFPGTTLYQRAILENIIDSSTNCLEPHFYVSPAITKERISVLLKSFHEAMPNWIIEDVPSEIIAVMKRLREKGVSGPLWEFLER